MTAARSMVYLTAGPHLSGFALDPSDASLQPRGEALQLPQGGQFACMHPALPLLYVVSSNGRPHGIAGDSHFLDVFAIGEDGALRQAGTSVALPQRPIHAAVHPRGTHLLIAYPFPSLLQVRELHANGAVLGTVPQSEDVSWGHVAHQVAFGPGAQPPLLLVTRGNDARIGEPEEPGALLVFDFADGRVSLRQKVAPNGGHGFGPRNIAFHPGGRWVHVSLERQHRFCVFDWDGARLGGQPVFSREVRSRPGASRPFQFVGPIACHPDGRTSYLTNRNDGVEFANGVPVFNGGENTIAVFGIDQHTGEPTLLQHVDSHGLHPRTFGIDPTGTVLIAANTTTGMVREGSGVRQVKSGLSVYRIEPDGRLSFVRKLDIDASPGLLFWMGIFTVPAPARP